MKDTLVETKLEGTSRMVCSGSNRGACQKREEMEFSEHHIKRDSEKGFEYHNREN